MLIFSVANSCTFSMSLKHEEKVCSGGRIERGQGVFLKEDFNCDCFEEKLKYCLYCTVQAKGKLA